MEGIKLEFSNMANRILSHKWDFSEPMSIPQLYTYNYSYEKGLS